MSPDNLRRTFLKTATAGMSALVALPGTAVAQSASAAAKTSYEVTAFGATGDGRTLDSPAINRAIEAAAAAGGGIVSFPAGTYLCYSIHLRSNVALYLAPGATLLAADPPSDPGSNPAYDLPESNAPWESYQDFGHNHWHNSLLWGEGLENVSITGPGLIWGKGLSRGWGAGPVAENPGVGNKAIALKNCRNVLLRDFSILHGGHFGILATGVDNLTIDNLKIDTNRDGMDLDCCRNVRVSNCSVNSPWDDAICLKSSFALGYARATEMVTISDCVVSGSFEEGTLLDATYKRFAAEVAAKVNRTGRIKFGTESNGGFKNITITNCVFDGCWGFALETVDGALLEDVTITNITMRDLIGAPIFMRLGARMRGPADVPVGALRRVLISNLVCSNAGSPVSSIISGIPGHEIEDVKLSNILIQHQGDQSATPMRLAEKEKDYPEPSMFGTTPAYGFFIRHAKGIEINDVEIQCVKEDARPAFVLDDVTRADFFRVTAPRVQGRPVIVLNNVKDFSVSRSKSVPDSEIESAERKEI